MKVASIFIRRVCYIRIALCMLDISVLLCKQSTVLCVIDNILGNDIISN